MNGLVQAQQGRYEEVFLNKSNSHYLLLQRPRLYLACLGLVVLLQFPLYSCWRRKSIAPCPFFAHFKLQKDAADWQQVRCPLHLPGSAPAPATRGPSVVAGVGDGPGWKMQGAVYPGVAFPNLPGQGDLVSESPKLIQGPVSATH